MNRLFPVAVLLVLGACNDTPVAPFTDAQLARVDNAANCWVIGDGAANDAGMPLGSLKNPFTSLADVQAATSCRNIEVLYSEVALDGGITLREGQKLRGHAGPDGALPVISNTTAANDGRGVVLADHSVVSGLHFTRTFASAIYGVDVDKVVIRDNELSDFNTGLNVHPRYQLIGNFRAYYGGIHLEDRVGGGRQTVSVLDNALHDAPTGGMHLITEEDGDLEIDARGNSFVRLGQHPTNPDPFPPDRPEPLPFSALENSAIWSVSYERSQLDLRLEDTTIEDHGPPAGGGHALIEFDGIDVFAGGSAVVHAVIDNYTFRNPGRRGNGFGDQPLHAGVDARADGAVFDLEVRNSHLEDPISAHMALTSYYSMRNADVRYRIVDNVMTGARIPFAPGVTVQHSGFAHLGEPSVGTTLDVELIGNVIRMRPGSRGDGFNLLNSAGTIDQLSVKIEGNVLDGSGSLGRGLRFYGNGETLVGVIDAGGGALGSRGGNSILDFATDVATIDLDVLARHNWWGSATGPDVLIIEGAGSIDVVPFLTSAPGN